MDKYIQKLTDLAEFFKYMLYALFAFLDIDSEVVEILFYLMLIDTISGIWKVIRVPELRFSFKELRLGFISKLMILFIPMSVALVAKGVGFDFKGFVTIIVKLLVVEQGISIVTNGIAIKQRKDLKNEDYVSMILHAIRDYFIGFVTTMVDNIKNRKSDGKD